jgi:hypothetical protein
MNKVLTALMAFLLMVFPSFPVVAGGIPSEPSFNTLRGWQPVRDGNMVLVFNEYEFKHHILTTPAPFPQCNQVQVKGREAWLLTPELHPSLYMIELQPNAFRQVGESEWHGMFEKSSGWIEK